MWMSTVTQMLNVVFEGLYNILQWFARVSRCRLVGRSVGRYAVNYVGYDIIICPVSTDEETDNVILRSTWCELNARLSCLAPCHSNVPATRTVARDTWKIRENSKRYDIMTCTVCTEDYVNIRIYFVIGGIVLLYVERVGMWRKASGPQRVSNWDGLHDDDRSTGPADPKGKEHCRR